jgi:hypothetical protein
MEKEIIDRSEGEVGEAIDLDSFGASPLSSQDIIMPKILVMQGLSKLVTDGKAKLGDFVDSMTSEVIGHIEDKPIEFIPFHLDKLWIVSKKDGNRYFFDHVEPVTAANENKSWEETKDGAEWKNEKSFNFYSLLTSDPSIPYVIQFKSTSLKTGRNLAAQMYVKNRADNLVPCAKSMFLAGSKVSNDKGTFAVLATDVSRATSQGEIAECLKWYKQIIGGAATAHAEDAAAAEETKPQF